MSKDIKISIVVPIYNAEKKLMKCLGSMQNQTLKEIEIVCIDDCSSDGSFTLLQKIAKQDDRINLLQNHKNMGTFATRKRGVAEAKGEYIMFADNDDWYEKEACSKLYDEIKKRNVDILMYEVNEVEPEDSEITVEKQRWVKKLGLEEESIKAEHCHKINNRMTWLWNRIVRAEVAKKAYGYAQNERLTYVEDAYGCWLIHFFAKSYETTRGAYYNYDYIGGTSNKSYYGIEEFKNKCEEFKKLEELLKKLFTDYNVAEENRWAVEYEYDRGLKVMCSFWQQKIDQDNAVELFDFLCEKYGREEVINRLHENVNRVANRRDSLIMKNKELKEKNNQLKNSASMKIGKAVTAIPRKMRKGSN